MAPLARRRSRDLASTTSARIALLASSSAQNQVRPEINLGFAIYGQGSDERALEPSTGEAVGTFTEGAEGRAASRAGVSGIADLGTGRTGQVLRVDANSNLIEARAVLLTLMAECDKGEEQGVWYVSGVFAIPSSGDLGAPKGWMKEWERRPTVPEEISASPI